MQVNPSLQNQKLRTDLRWAAKRIRKSALKFTQVAKGRKFHAYTVDGETLAHEFEIELDQSQEHPSEVFHKICVPHYILC